ncbi:MAG: hypothetical protein ACLTSX_01145 [Collinsella sp.]
MPPHQRRPLEFGSGNRARRNRGRCACGRWKSRWRTMSARCGRRARLHVHGLESQHLALAFRTSLNYLEGMVLPAPVFAAE